MLVTDSNILKSFSEEFGPLFKIGDSHAQGIYKKPLDRVWVESRLKRADFYKNAEKAEKIKAFLTKYFSKGDETYDAIAYRGLRTGD